MSTSAPQTPPPRRLRRWVLRFALVVLPTLFLFAVVEVALRLSGYGYDPRYFIPLQDAPGWVRANERFVWRFMPRELARRPAVERVQMPKPPGTYRVFVLGSSAARGFPNSAFSVGRFLEVMLHARMPGQRIEVINTGVTAINSHVVRLIAMECAQLSPDAFVVYTGNNEVVGPYGPGTTLNGVRQNRGVIRFTSWLSEWRTGQWLLSLAQPTAAGSAQQWRGLEMFAENPVPSGDPRLAAVRENYRANLADIVSAGKSAGAKVVLCTVPVNLRDCAPFGSGHTASLGEKERTSFDRDLASAHAAAREGRFDDAFKSAAELVVRDPLHADARFLMGRLHWQREQWDDARAQFQAACELDTLRFRADAACNAAIREVATRAGAALADLEKAFASAQKASHGVPGAELFLEHVHLRFEGTYAAAQTIMLELQGPGPLPSAEECGAALAYTPFDAAADAQQGIGIISRPPFTLQSNHQEQLAALTREHAAILAAATTPATLRNTRAHYEKILAERPDDFWVLGNFAELLQRIGDRPAELAARERAVALRAEDVHARLKLATVCWATDATRAEKLLTDAARELPRTPQNLKTLGDQFLAHDQPAVAAARYREALALWPEYVEAMQNLAAVLVRENQPAEAEQILIGAIKLKDDATSRSNLASLLTKQGRHAEALPHLERLVSFEPANAAARLQHGRALLATGKLDEAEAAARAAQQIEPHAARSFIVLAEIAERRGQWAVAERSYRNALTAERGAIVAGQKLAWLLATSPDFTARDPAEAEQIMKSMIAAAPVPIPELYDTLGAALAALGRFPEAVQSARKAAQLAGNAKMTEFAAAVELRVKLYESGKAFVQPAR